MYIQTIKSPDSESKKPFGNGYSVTAGYTCEKETGANLALKMLVGMPWISFLIYLCFISKTEEVMTTVHEDEMRRGVAGTQHGVRAQQMLAPFLLLSELPTMPNFDMRI